MVVPKSTLQYHRAHASKPACAVQPHIANSTSAGTSAQSPDAVDDDTMESPFSSCDELGQSAVMCGYSTDTSTRTEMPSDSEQPALSDKETEHFSVTHECGDYTGVPLKATATLGDLSSSEESSGSDLFSPSISDEEECDENLPAGPPQLPLESDLIKRCIEEFGNETLPNSTMTKVSAVAMLMSFVSTHNLSWSALDDLVKLVNGCLGTTNAIPGSKYLFRKLWAPRTAQLSKRYYYCATVDCAGLLERERDNAFICTKCRAICTSDQTLRSDNFFTLLDMKEQVNHAIRSNTKGLAENLERIEKMRTLGSTAVRDTTSGTVYTNLRKNGTLKPGDLTLTVSTDGSPVFKSSQSSIWPIQFVVNEIPPETRLGHAILAGLWFGKKHPNMDIFMRKFAEGVGGMEPVQWADGTRQYTSVRLLYCCADAPARAQVQNHVLFSGYYGCPWCLITGTHEKGRTLLMYFEGQIRASCLRNGVGMGRGVTIGKPSAGSVRVASASVSDGSGG